MLDQRFTTSIHIMTSLAFHQKQGDELMTSEYLANGIRTNPTVVRRLVSKLVEAGLVKSYKGKSGGMELAKKPDLITLKDIYLASTENKLIHCAEKAPLKQCAVSCSMKKILGEVINGVEENSLSYLAQIKLSELTSKIS